MNHLSMPSSGTPRRVRGPISLVLVLASALLLSLGTAWAGNDNNQGNENDQGNGTKTTSAPEIDSSVAVSALAILTGGILVVGDRVRKSRRNGEG
jgi:hypothetical protein